MMDFICFKIKETKIALSILDVYTVLVNSQLTYFINTENKAIFMTRFLDEHIPVYDINNEMDISNRLVVVLNSEPLISILVDEASDIKREEIPTDYRLMSVDDILTSLKSNKELITNNEIELF